MLVDLGNTCQQGNSIFGYTQISGVSNAICPASGAVIGLGIHMGNADTFCNLQVAGQTISGQLRIQVQTAPTDTSGLYTDPYSGAPQYPGAFASGMILWINSGGLLGGTLGGLISGHAVASGFAEAQGFQRNNLYVRANILLEGAAQYAGPLTVQFISQLRTTGSGGGFTYSPSSGTVNV